MSVELLAALVVGLLVVNVTVAWLLARGDGLDAFLEADAWAPSDRNGGPDADDRRSAERDAEHAAGHEGRDAIPNGDPPPLAADGEVVVCRHCGADNRPGYRYCRWCVRAGVAESGHASSSHTATSQRPF